MSPAAGQRLPAWLWLPPSAASCSCSLIWRSAPLRSTASPPPPKLMCSSWHLVSGCTATGAQLAAHSGAVLASSFAQGGSPAGVVTGSPAHLYFSCASAGSVPLAELGIQHSEECACAEESCPGRQPPLQGGCAEQQYDPDAHLGPRCALLHENGLPCKAVPASCVECQARAAGLGAATLLVGFQPVPGSVCSYFLNRVVLCAGLGSPTFTYTRTRIYPWGSSACQPTRRYPCTTTPA